MAVIVEDGKLTLTGFVGESTLEFDGWTAFDGFTHAEVVTALGSIGDDVDLTVHINSGGGYATEGSAIRAALTDRGGRTDVVIDGIAASAASVIAMAGESVRMSLGSTLMIHDPSGFTVGTKADHEKSIRALDALGNTYARVYARKSGKPEDECRTMMRDETWMTPQEAVEAGFADEETDAPAQAVAAYPYQDYAHAPKPLKAMANAQGWRRPPPVLASFNPERTAPNPQPVTQETPAMTTNPQAPATAAAAPTTPSASDDPAGAERQRMQAIMTAEAARGQTALAEHFAYQTAMTAEDAIAALTAAAEGKPPEAAAPPNDGQPDPASYAASRSPVAALAQPAGGGDLSPQRTALAAAVDRTNKRR